MWFLFLALANRCRDGLITEILPPSNSIAQFFTKNSQMGRLILWAIPFAIALYFSHPLHAVWQSDLFYFISLIAATFGGACCANWGTTDHPPFTLGSCLQLAVNGIIFTGIPAVVCIFAGFPNYIFAAAIALSGLLIVPAYIIGWSINSSIPGFQTGTKLGSALFGLFIGITIFLWR